MIVPHQGFNPALYTGVMLTEQSRIIANVSSYFDTLKGAGCVTCLAVNDAQPYVTMCCHMTKHVNMSTFRPC